MDSDTLTVMSNLHRDVANAKADSKRLKEIVATQLKYHDDHIQEIDMHLNTNEKRMDSFEACLQKLSGLAILCKDFDARLSAHEHKIVGDLTSEVGISGTVDDDGYDAEEYAELLETQTTTQESSVIGRQTGMAGHAVGQNMELWLCSKAWQDMELRQQTFESKLENRVQTFESQLQGFESKLENMPALENIPKTFKSRLRAHEERLDDLVHDQHLHLNIVETCMQELSGLVAWCKDFEARLAAHENEPVGDLTSEAGISGTVNDDGHDVEGDAELLERSSVEYKDVQQQRMPQESSTIGQQSGMAGHAVCQDVEAWLFSKAWQDKESKLENRLQAFESKLQTFESKLNNQPAFDPSRLLHRT